jgi:hypothetical protein
VHLIQYMGRYLNNMGGVHLPRLLACALQYRYMHCNTVVTWSSLRSRHIGGCVYITG